MSPTKSQIRPYARRVECAACSVGCGCGTSPFPVIRPFSQFFPRGTRLPPARHVAWFPQLTHSQPASARPSQSARAPHQDMVSRTLALVATLVCVAKATNEFGLGFLAQNKDKEGVITLPSGLQYKVLRAGEGDSHPTVSSPCECHYEGRTASNYPSGAKFDSSYDRGAPATFAPNQVIKGCKLCPRSRLLVPVSCCTPERRCPVLSQGPRPCN